MNNKETEKEIEELIKDAYESSPKREKVLERLKTFDWSTLDDECLMEAYSVTFPTLKYNSDFGDFRTCKCGHAYYRHLDSFEVGGRSIGCKYCPCEEFDEEEKEEKKS